MGRDPMRDLPSECSQCGASMPDGPVDDPCGKCGNPGRMYAGENASKHMFRLGWLNTEFNPSLEPSYGHLAAQVNRRIDRVAAMYDDVEHTDVDDLLDDLDALLVSVWHLYDWILNDPSLDSRIGQRVPGFVNESRPLTVCRAYVNSYKHLVRRGSCQDYARILKYRRKAGSRPSVQIVWWTGSPPPEEFTESIEALDLARQGMAEWVRFAEEHGDPDGVSGVQTPEP